MTETANKVIDSRLLEALEGYFNGVRLDRLVGDCSVLIGIRKQNGAPVDIYTPSHAASRADAVVDAIAKDFATYEKLSHRRLQAHERLLATRAFRKSPALALLSCPVAVFDEAFDLHPVDFRLRILDEILDGLAALHGVGLVHGNLSDRAVRREDPDSGLRLCDFTFAGGRPTVINDQLIAYQTRHVVNTAQPRIEDDIHAAGMLGYRILLGLGGETRVLTGRTDEDGSEQLIAALLGQTTEAPDGATLFPDGHKSAAQIARLLARMTGRLPNAAPYSSAGAAHRALRSVLVNPHDGMAEDAAVTPSAAAAQEAPARHGAPVVVKQGVSQVTAVTLFLGFLVSTGAAVWLYFDGTKAEQTAAALIQRLTSVAEEARIEAEQRLAERDTATAALAGLQAAQPVLREAERLVHEARLAGAVNAAPGPFAAAEAGLDAAYTAFAKQNAETAANAATDAAEAATLALTEISALHQRIAEARLTALMAVDGYHLASGGDDLPDEAASRLGAAEADTTEGRLAEAVDGWLALTLALEADTQGLRDAAAAGRDAAANALARVGDQDSATFLVARRVYDQLLADGDAAFQSGAFTRASDHYSRAAARFGPEDEGGADLALVEPREVILGDSVEQIEAALRLCTVWVTDAQSQCPTARAHDEGQRRDTVRPFALDPAEVSAAEFARFVDATGYVTAAESGTAPVILTAAGFASDAPGYSWRSPAGPGSDWQSGSDRPVTVVSAQEAQAYCDWRGARLPREAEWEYAARPAPDHAFPWGGMDAVEPLQAADGPVWRGGAEGRSRPVATTAAGGATPQGIVGLAGNAREWVLLPGGGAALKGGSWNSVNPADLRIAARLAMDPQRPGVDFGFRCATDLDVWED